ncbi:MAG: histidine phosphatase family protein [Phycisphaeraceae bacterium]
MTSTTLFLVRHGETVWHAENRYAGRSDIDLTPRGHEQAASLATWARTARLDALWVSPLKRARETAAPAARATALEPRVDDRLRELDFGDGEGRTVGEMERLFPEAVAAYRADPVAHHLPNGEDPRAAAERACAALETIAGAHAGGRVLVVFHNTLMRLTLCRLLGIELGRYRQVFPQVRNVALTQVRMTEAEAALLAFNVPVGGAEAL